MTKKEMIIRLVDEQIKRGVINASKRARQIAWRVKAMTKAQVEEWYADIFSE